MSQVTLRVNTFSGGDMCSISNYWSKRMVLNDKIKKILLGPNFVFIIYQSKQTNHYFLFYTFALLFKYCFSCKAGCLSVFIPIATSVTWFGVILGIEAVAGRDWFGIGPWSIRFVAHLQQEVETPGCPCTPNIRSHSLVESSKSLLRPDALHTVQKTSVLRS